MVNLVFCINSRESFKRISNTLKIDEDIELENYVPALENLQENIIIKQYDLAVVDEKLSWYDEALDLLNKKGVEIVLFKGDFKKTISDIYKKLPKDKKDLEKSQKENKAHLTGISYDKSYYIKKEMLSGEASLPLKNESYDALENKIIIIGGLSKGAGSTFLSVNLAKALTDLKIRTSVIEPPVDEPYLFYYLGIDKKLNAKCMESSFYSYPNQIDAGQKVLKSMETIIDDIIWFMANPFERKIEIWDHIKMLMLLDCSRRSPINIIDAGINYEHESIDPLMSGADVILIAINPLPAELRQNEGKLKNLIKLKKDGYPIAFVVNYYTPAIIKKDLLNYLKPIPAIFIPAIETRYIQEAANKNILPLVHPQISEKLFTPLSEIVKNIIPLNILKESINNNSFNNVNIIYKLKEKITGLKKVFSGFKV